MFSHRGIKGILFFLLLVSLILVKFWLTSVQSINIVPEAAFDDFLFITQADNILHGEWLGNYNSLTLMKGSFYPLWIALTHLFNIKLLYAQRLLYVFASWLMALFLTLNVKKNKKKIFLIVFVALLFNPFSFDEEINLRANRPAIYYSITSIVFASFIGILNWVRKGRLSNSRNVLIFFLLLAFGGFFLGLSWITREETIWVIPSVTLLLVINSIYLYTQKKTYYMFFFLDNPHVLLLSSIRNGGFSEQKKIW